MARTAREETAATGEGSSTSTREATVEEKLDLMPCRDHRESAFFARARTF
jgi:hypothetical protein